MKKENRKEEGCGDQELTDRILSLLA